MPSFLINSFNSGFSDYENKGVRGAFKAGSKALDIRKLIDSLSCQQALVDETPAGWNELALFHVVASDGNSYFFLRNGKIFRRTAAGSYLLVYTDTNESGNIIGAAEFSDTSGNYFLFWATPTRLMVKRIVGTGYTNTEPWADVNTVPVGTFPKTNLTSSDWHTMKRVGSSLLIANDNTLAFVGIDMSYTNNGLQLVPGNKATTVIERGVNAVIGCKRKDSADMSAFFLWDLISDNYVDKKYIPVKDLMAIIDTDKPLALAGDQGAIYYADFNNVLPITYFPNGGKVYPDGVENDEGVALFGVFGGSSGSSGIYSYGKKRNNAPYALNFDYPITADEIGSVKKVGTDIFVTIKDGSNYYVKKVDTTAKATATYISLDLEIPAKYYTDELPTFTSIKLKTKPLPAGTSIQAYRMIDKNTSTGFLQCNTEDGSTSYNTTDSEEALFYIGDQGKIINAEIVLTPNGNVSPEVLSIEVFFDPATS